MFWLPVIFVCAAAECGFYFDTGLSTKNQCVKRLNEIMADMGKNPDIKIAKGSCLDVNAPTTGGRI